MKYIRPETLEAYCKMRGVGVDEDFFEMCLICADWDRFQELERKRRVRNRLRGLRLHARLSFVRDYDIWKQCKGIENREEKYLMAKAIYRRKARLLLVLTDLYNYNMFDDVRMPHRKCPMKFSALRRRYNRDLLAAAVRQRRN